MIVAISFEDSSNGRVLYRCLLWQSVESSAMSQSVSYAAATAARNVLTPPQYSLRKRSQLNTNGAIRLVPRPNKVVLPGYLCSVTQMDPSYRLVFNHILWRCSASVKKTADDRDK
jgi:hypothetical protein